MNSTTQEPKECMLLAGVCDIRGFSTLQARIDDFIVSRLTSDKRSDVLARANIEFMVQSRQRTEAIFKHHLSSVVSESEYAIKSTGDGFLVAIKLVDLGMGTEICITDDDYFARFKWVEKAKCVIDALAALYEESALTATEGIAVGRQTAAFLDENGPLLGISIEKCSEKGEYRIPGALAIGSGTLSPAGVDFSAGSGNRGDAYGHPVNVAFRLCDKAGRWDEVNGISPAVLFDRRVGRVIQAAKIEVVGWTIEPGYHVELKGIEENWCYGLRPNGIPKIAA